MSTRAVSDLRTTQPLWFPKYSTAPEHLHRVVDAVMVVAPERDGIGATQPSRLAHDMVERVTILAGERAYLEGSSQVVQAAADEAVAMLGAYIKRLERVAQQYAAHLARCDRAP